MLQFFVLFILSREIIAACECEVSGWTQWSTKCSKTCDGGYISRTRVCSTNNGWTLGLTCSAKDESTVTQQKHCNTQKCRKFSNKHLMNFLYRY